MWNINKGVLIKVLSVVTKITEIVVELNFILKYTEMCCMVMCQSQSGSTLLFIMTLSRWWTFVWLSLFVLSYILFWFSFGTTPSGAQSLHPALCSGVRVFEGPEAVPGIWTDQQLSGQTPTPILYFCTTYVQCSIIDTYYLVKKKYKCDSKVKAM